MNIKVFVILSAIVFCATSFVKKDEKSAIVDKLKKINEYYLTNPNYSVDIDYLVYENSNASVPDEISKGFVKLFNGMEHSYCLSPL